MLNVGINRAVTLIAEKRANPGKGRRFGGDPGRSVGDHPQRGGPILVKKGRYGPYVTNSGINATIPDNIVPDEITLDQAVGADRSAGREDRREARTAPQGPAQGCSASRRRRPRPRQSLPRPRKKKAAKPKKTITAAE